MSLLLAASQATAVFAQRDSMFAAAATHAALYGFSVPLFLTCIVVKQRQCNANSGYRPLGRALIAYTILLFVVSTFSVIAHLRFFHLTLITHSDNPKYASVLDTPLHVIDNLLLGLGATLGDSIMIWRCYVVWSRRYGVVLIPLFLTLGTLTFTIVWTVYIARSDAKAFLTLGIVVTSLSVSTNIIVTALISARILWTSRHLRCVLSKEQLKPYNSAIGIIVESAALYSGSGLVFIVTFALGIPGEQVTVSIYAVMPFIASYLIIIRVGLGLGIRESNSTMVESMVSSPADNHVAHELKTIGNKHISGTDVYSDCLTLSHSASRKALHSELDTSNPNDNVDRKVTSPSFQNSDLFV